MQKYDPKTIEPKWQKVWAESKIYEVEEDPSKNKIYATPMLPYPSGTGLHVGHVRNYSISDAVARFYRQRGHNVMSNMGWDAFGLPAENYAIKTGTPPRETTQENIDNFRNQLKRLGMSIAWDREVNTSDPEYYKWTQWIFTQFFENDLAYQAKSLQWWCPKCKTVLANEQVVNGCCWRHEDTEVEKRETKQWFFKITEYADVLLDELENLDWPEGILAQQRNWIGRSVGAEIDFKVDGHKDSIKVFTTRPDTIFGATFLVLAPEHDLVEKICTKEQATELKKYVHDSVQKSDVERMDEGKEKSGVFTEAHAINPMTKEKIPIWVSDFVLGSYGTGAIMAVPGHDQRDNDFASKFDLPIIDVYNPSTGQPQQDPVDKKKIVAVVENKKGEILTINWKPELGGRLLVGGGIKNDEDPRVTAEREITEETGYNDFEFIEQADETVFHQYYAFSKKTPVNAITNILHFKLKSDSKEEIKLEADEQGHFEVEWVDKDRAFNEIHDEQHLRVLDRFIFKRVFSGEGIMKNSGEYDDMPTSEAREKIIEDLSKQKIGAEKVQYKIRDWLISRQRYWGAPIPIIHCEKCGAVPVPEKDLPVELPHVEDYAPTGETVSVLAGVEEWVNVDCPKCDGPAKRETDTMDGYACSSWYMHRYTDATNEKMAWDPKKLDYWFPVDFYFGGDHAVSHLLYFRFWNHFFADQGLVAKSKAEPVKKLVFNGYINAEDGRKMSKSYGNVVDPLEIIDSGYGADALRVYELFIGPYDQDVDWNTSGVPGTFRFLNRVWNLVDEFLEAEAGGTADTEKELLLRTATHKTIKKVTEDLSDMRFNTAIAAQMELVNTLNKLKEELPFTQAHETWRQSLTQLVQVLAPFAPHIAEELFNELGQDESVHTSAWPVWDEELVVDALITIVVQVNGKVRANLTVSADATEDEIVELAKQDENVLKHIAKGENIKRTVYVPSKLVNFVI